MTELLAVITITILAVISPGPDFAMVSRNSLMVSRRAGIVTACGIGAGVLVHVSYALLGIGLLIQRSLVLFTVIKLAGAGYLLFLGVRMLRSKGHTGDSDGQVPVLSDLAALRTGFLTNVLNPKTSIFVVSLFLQVVNPGTGLDRQIAYGAFIAATHVLWFVLVTLFFSAPAIRVRIIAARRWIDRAFGALLVGFATLLASRTAMP